MTATATAEITAVAEKKYTVEEYFELERHSTLRHEFVNGKLYKMPEKAESPIELQGIVILGSN